MMEELGEIQWLRRRLSYKVRGVNRTVDNIRWCFLGIVEPPLPMKTWLGLLTGPVNVAALV
jgi:hypothetical protein